jgi:CelD/BcsL family acetyltransferase involved in cellulose biosynthesis
MQLSIIRDWKELADLAEEWNDLLACCSASHVPFLRHEYLSAWWQNLGGGEWSQADLHTIVVRRNDDLLVGIAPLFFGINKDRIRAFMLLGSIEISDYLDFIVRQPEIPVFMDAIFEYLASDQFSQNTQLPDWQVMDLYNLSEISPTLPALKVAAERRGWEYTQQQLQSCPYIPLPGDWEVYLSGIDKKQRHEIRRKMRRVEDYPAPTRWYIVENEVELEAEMDDFFSLMAQDLEKDRFLTTTMRVQMHSIARAAFQSGWLQLAFLEVEGKKAAGYMNFDYAGHIWVYNSGLNFGYRELSPGWVLLGDLLKWAVENHRESFDFMRGDEDYKYRFGGINRYVVRATIKKQPS